MAGPEAVIAEAAVPEAVALVPSEGGGVDGEPEFRLASGTGGRAALEVARGGEVVAVDVANAFSAPVLGGLRGGGAAAAWAVAWGCLPPDGGGVTVEFGRGRAGRRRAAVPVRAVGPFWVARTRGRFTTVTVGVGTADPASGRGAGRQQRWRLAGR
ncbi:hypothetical protein [Streptantibioticus silvisoli]|uniref:Uncharacterized protein n=1 Tax=Streptantibioticus silvisoli TaxID=2705255 RepID=A0ABT6W2T8_9ACTN|nr:hypothetical protein [Streptantibioticus silvisoli]MDI5965055.1 hypothetical protein [Streptantibioticus silvisoli]